MKLRDRTPRDVVWVSFRDMLYTNWSCLSAQRKLLPQTTKRKLMKQQEHLTHNMGKNPRQNDPGKFYHLDNQLHPCWVSKQWVCLSKLHFIWAARVGNTTYWRHTYHAKSSVTLTLKITRVTSWIYFLSAYFWLLICFHIKEDSAIKNKPYFPFYYPIPRFTETWF